MKARETVLLYHITEKEKEKRLKRVLLLMGVRMRMVEPEQYGLSIESLLRGNTADAECTVNTVNTASTVNAASAVVENTVSAENTADTIIDAGDAKDITNEIQNEATHKSVNEIADEMLVMYGFSAKRLDDFLAALRKNQARVDLKAVVTDTNKKWNSLQLYAELKREHEVMHEKKSF